MSFISILKKVGDVAVGVETILAPIAETVFPQYAGPIAALDGVFHRLLGNVTTVETQNPDGQGSAKLASVATQFASELEFTQQVLASEGKKMTYDDAALQAAINSQVAAFNAFAALKASFKIVPIVPVAPTA